ncbi:MAG: DUF177 domain-containing protein [Aquabacterium sp.]|uniref:YceD family protein n=1 Tax=Aquabacterium sp. TaxID=1872578 RepID=UPI001D5EC143|nr:YceD family protein [Aquabacterium sp.]MBT9611472.1 DUF177 domain-containing protein [Aquabacterium sp.]
MKPRSFVPEKLDIQAFIEEGAALSGELPVAALTRVAAGLMPGLDLGDLPAVRWSAQGRVVPQRVGGPQLWLDLQAEAELEWECQRCLHGVREPLVIDLQIRFARDEAEAARLDAESDEDVLPLARHIHLAELLEDELIMAQPLVPRHGVCPTDVESLMCDERETPVPGAPAPTSTQAEAADTPEPARQKPHPFAALAALKKPPKA